MAVPTVPPKDMAVTSKDVTYGDAHSASLAAVLTEKQDPCTHLPQANTQGMSPHHIPGCRQLCVLGTSTCSAQTMEHGNNFTY